MRLPKLCPNPIWAHTYPCQPLPPVGVGVGWNEFEYKNTLKSTR